MGINFFEAYFNEQVLNPTGDTQVCCPFPHQIGDKQYYEVNPSAGVNLDKNVFHCFSCGKAYSEISFAAEILQTSYNNAAKFVDILHHADHIEKWNYAEKNLEQIQKVKDYIINNLYITPQVIKELHIGCSSSSDVIKFTIPIIMYDHIVDKTTYQPKQTPKYIRTTNSLSGLICPFDIWIKSKKSRPTLICAGEKDMLIARSKGFNAITFTGGEMNTPTMFLNQFNDRPVYIIYDNDEAGKLGSQKLAIALRRHTKSTHIVDLSQTCINKGEDLWDYFCKYNKTKEDLIQLLKETPEFTEEELIQLDKQLNPLIPLSESIKPQNINKTLKSYIQVIATIDTAFAAPTFITALKKDSMNSDTLQVGETRTWSLNDNNYKDLFYMIDSNLKEKAIDLYIKTNLLGIPQKEQGIDIKKEARATIHKCTVTEFNENFNSNQTIELIAFSINNKLETGKKYIATYKIVPHPQDGQKLIMVIKDVEESDDFLTKFKITDEVKESLKKFQKQDTVANKVNELIQYAKGIVQADYNETLLKVIDIWFHSALQFSVGTMKDIRGYIDALVIGESRIGKSSTVTAFQEMYGVGKIVSLAGASATPAGLIGGSNKTTGGAYQTRAGIIPQNNRGAVIFEELIKCKSDLIKELTDIRSSNLVRISRVNGTIVLPAYVRMLTLTNSKTKDNVPRPITSYPNGISILTDIIGTPEDIARYDMIAIFGFEADKQIDPFYEPPQPLPQKDYQNRIRWIWSRTQDQIYISKSIYQYTVRMANDINNEYGTFINIFGVEAWKKILRIAVAIAGYVCSTDENFEEIIVTEEHVDEAIKLLLELYDNKTFKLKEYVQDEKKNNIVSEDDIKTMQEIWGVNPILVNYLIKNPETNQSNLQLVCGLNKDDFVRLAYKLISCNLIRIEKSAIFTTNKFNLCFNKIDQNVSVNKEVIFKYED